MSTSLQRPVTWFALACLAVQFATHAADGRMTLGTALRQTSDWFASEEGRRLTTNVLSWQTPQGSWPKNTDTLTKPFQGDRSTLKGIYDNGATRNELRFLARAFQSTTNAACSSAVQRGLADILAAQYPSGGWPQSHPAGTGYARHITFNDGTMVGLMEWLREVSTNSLYAFLGEEQRAEAARAFERGVACIVKCQVVAEGKRTVWCAQHDAVTLKPQPARSYELVSLSGAESAGILLLLMSLDAPSREVRESIAAGAAWFERSKLTGIRQVRIDGDKRITQDADAPPLWARFYEIDTNRPFFCGRDGVKKYDIADIEAERRNGYSWYGDWGTTVANAFARWQKQWNRF
jgi:pectate lyase